jgi:hypothetical protein
MAHKVLTDESFNDKLDGLIEAVAKGKQGDPGVSATHFWEGTVLTVTSASGTSSADLQGPQGPQGPQGLQGVQGPQGEQGVQGVQGPAGEDGKNGVDGKDGDDGVSVQSATVNGNGRLILTLTNGKTIDCGIAKGADGQQGPKGDQGIQGPRGEPFSIAKTYSSVAEMEANFAIDGVPTGGFVLIDTANVNDQDNAKLFYKGYYAYVYLTDLSGAQGIQGPQGIQGVQGPKGDTGKEGPQGPKGDQGVQGVQGAQGPNGKSAYEIWLANGNSGTEATFLASLKGAKGDQGEQGIQGIQGVQGEQGIQGEKGDKGDTGFPGVKGDKGDTGAPGEPGKDGVSVTHSWSGTVLNVTSASGTSSADLKGEKGEKGDKGDKGEQGPAGPTDATVVKAPSTFTDGEILTADGNARNAKSSGKKIVTLDIGKDIVDAMTKIPASRVAEIPSMYSLAYTARETMPTYMPMAIFAKGKELYPSTHADYNKMIFVGNERGWNMTVGNAEIVGGTDNLTKTATQLAKVLDREYSISNVTKGMYNPLITHVEYSWEYVPVDGNVNDKVLMHTIKIEVDASQQDSLASLSAGTGGWIWLQKSVPYYNQQFYIAPDAL